ncbi:MAG: BMP family ABC transporter substrate-binding protein [Clostridia bacterium]|nr:BMP family ABC transporter substrate-binding protein [Clostridia bacterium]
MKKLIAFLSIFAIILSGCTADNGINTYEEPVSTSDNSRVPYNSFAPDERERAFVMMDSGADQSFSAYKGIDRAAGELGYDLIVEFHYDLNDGTVLENIQKHGSDGREYILLPGEEFGSSVLQTYSIFPDVNFVLLDSELLIGENVTSFSFNGYDIGVLAGFTAAMELKFAEFGFIGGADTGENSLYLEGFRDGLKMAEDIAGISVNLSEENILYNESFFNMDSAAVLAKQLYELGVDAIFIAAGEAGRGVIAEAGLRAFSGEDVWVIGADDDWYERGIYNGSDSVVLTSAVKRFDTAAYIASVMFANDELGNLDNIQGTLKNGAIGLPDENPNLSQDTLELINELFH